MSAPHEAQGFALYRRTAIAEMAEWHEGFGMDGVSISEPDREAGSPKLGDMIARNPKNHADRWLVAHAYFKENFAELPSPSAQGSSAAAPHEEAAERLRKEMRGQGHDGDLFDDLRLVLDEYAERGRQLDRVYRWIRNANLANRVDPDHACAQCVPHSDILIEGFVCVLHLALAKLGGEGV